MKNVFTGLVLLSALIFSLSSCKRNRTIGEGEIKTETRNTGSFTSVDLATSLKAIITVDPASQVSVQLKGYQNILKLITTEVVNGKLVIDTDDLIDFDSDKDVIAEITVPSLSALEISGTADAEIKGTVSGDKFNVLVSGAGDVTIDAVTADVFDVKLTGAGELNVNGGSVNKLAYKVTGAGEISSFQLQSKEATVKVSGMGDVELSVSDKLDASITGAGDVNYKGHPQLSTKITGGGSIEEVK